MAIMKPMLDIEHLQEVLEVKQYIDEAVAEEEDIQNIKFVEAMDRLEVEKIEIQKSIFVHCKCLNSFLTIQFLVM